MKDQKPKTFLGSGYEQIDLKFIFDHIRNIGIAAALLIAAIKFGQTDLNTAFPKLPVAVKYLASIVALISLVLVAINFSQFMYIATRKGSKLAKSIWAALALPLYGVTAAIFVAYVSGALNP